MHPTRPSRRGKLAIAAITGLLAALLSVSTAGAQANDSEIPDISRIVPQWHPDSRPPDAPISEFVQYDKLVVTVELDDRQPTNVSALTFFFGPDYTPAITHSIDWTSRWTFDVTITVVGGPGRQDLSGMILEDTDNDARTWDWTQDAFTLTDGEWWGPTLNFLDIEMSKMAHITTPRPCNGFEPTVDIAAGEQPTEGDDVILGTPFDDFIDGLGGNDTVCGLDGADLIVGGMGADTIYGDGGNDLLVGDLPEDGITGDDDHIDGGRGDDVVFGGGGRDQLFGSKDDDRVFGEDGKDHVVGGTGNDFLHGGRGHDRLRGRAGNDVLHGGAGRDTMFGNAGRDELHGDNGDDILRGGPARDTGNGGPGTDDCRLDDAVNCP